MVRLPELDVKRGNGLRRTEERVVADLVLVETVGFVGVLAALSWAGSRGGLRARGWLGRGLRLGAFAAVAGCQVLLLGPPGGGAAHDPGGFWLAELAMLLVVAGTVALTARRGGAAERELRRTATLVVAGAGVCLTALLASGGVRAFPVLALLVVAAVVTLAARDGALVGVFGAGAAVCVLIFLTSVGLYRIFPGLVPGTAARAETNLIESTDPYVLDLLLGGVFGAAAVLAWAAAGLRSADACAGHQAAPAGAAPPAGGTRPADRPATR